MNIQQYQEDTLKKFEEKFVPLKPGFSVCKDWVKNLEGTTANYMTLQSFIKEALKGQLEVVEEIVDWELTPHGYESDDKDYEHFACELKEKYKNKILSKITPLPEEIKRTN